MSLRRQRVPFRKYAELPSLETTRLSETSAKPAYCPPSCPSELSKTSSTEAVPTGLRELEPLNTTSAMESPRKCLAEISPMTQRTASMMFDLPQPFGPTIPMRLLGRLTVVGSTKDLKPASLILLSRIALRAEAALLSCHVAIACVCGVHAHDAYRSSAPAASSMTVSVRETNPRSQHQMTFATAMKVGVLAGRNGRISTDKPSGTCRSFFGCTCRAPSV
jgi:hypothetical protein